MTRHPENLTTPSPAQRRLRGANRVFLDIAAEPVGATLTVEADAAHHLRDVMRSRIGDEIIIICSDARALRARITALSPSLTAEILAVDAYQQPKSFADTILIGAPKGDTVDLIAEKLTELGVQRVVFFEAEHSARRLDKNQCEKKKSRLLRVATAAAKQSGRMLVPQVEYIAGGDSLNQALVSLPTPRFVCSLQADARPLADTIVARGAASIIVGPEGDFSPREEQLLRSHGCIPITLGPLVLRVETAAIAAVAALNAVWGFQVEPQGGE